jgi:hypothetical protein
VHLQVLWKLAGPEQQVLLGKPKTLLALPT